MSRARVDGLHVEEMADRAGGEVGVGERQAPQAHVGNEAEATSTNLPDGLGREDASKEDLLAKCKALSG